MTGGHQLKRHGFFYAPTVLDSVRKDDNVFKDEIFGPVLAITTYRDFEQVIEDANDTNAGLSSYIFSENLTEVMTATERLKFGKYMQIVRLKKSLMAITQVGVNQA